jgi:hypothetical protein
MSIPDPDPWPLTLPLALPLPLAPALPLIPARPLTPIYCFNSKKRSQIIPPIYFKPVSLKEIQNCAGLLATSKRF